MLTAQINGEHIVNKIVEALSENYKVKFDPKINVLNSANYGVPQIRKRVIIIGVRKDIDIEPEEMYAGITKTHYDPEMGKDERKGLIKYVTVRDAIEELPAVKPGEGEQEIQFESKKNNEFLKRIASNENILRDHVARNHNDKDIERYIAMSSNHWSFQELLEKRPDLNHENKECLEIVIRYSGGISRLRQLLRICIKMEISLFIQIVLKDGHLLLEKLQEYNHSRMTLCLKDPVQNNLNKLGMRFHRYWQKQLPSV